VLVRLTTAKVSAKVPARGRNIDESLKPDATFGEAGSGRECTARSGDEGVRETVLSSTARGKAFSEILQEVR
jgi:hypothetical protein